MLSAPSARKTTRKYESVHYLVAIWMTCVRVIFLPTAQTHNKWNIALASRHAYTHARNGKFRLWLAVLALHCTTNNTICQHDVVLTNTICQHDVNCNHEHAMYANILVIHAWSGGKQLTFCPSIQRTIVGLLWCGKGSIRRERRRGAQHQEDAFSAHDVTAGNTQNAMATTRVPLNNLTLSS